MKIPNHALYLIVLSTMVLLPSKVPCQDPKAEPKLFAPGIVSTEFNETSVTFTPDGHTVYFTRSDLGGDNTILVSNRKDGKWGMPEVASFSGEWRDSEPYICPDGSKLYFVSNRPPRPGAEPLVTPRGSPGANIWYVEKVGNKWGDPVHIEGPINSVPTVYNPSVANNGTIYFSGILPEGGPQNQIYRSVQVKGFYGKPELVSVSNPKWNNMDPSISPDERFMVFISSRPGTIANSNDVFIVIRNGEDWGEPVSFGEPINGPQLENAPSLGRDGKTLYFTSMRRKINSYPKKREKFVDVETRLHEIENGSRNIWMVDISTWTKGLM